MNRVSLLRWGTVKRMSEPRQRRWIRVSELRLVWLIVWVNELKWGRRINWFSELSMSCFWKHSLWISLSIQKNFCITFLLRQRMNSTLCLKQRESLYLIFQETKIFNLTATSFCSVQVNFSILSSIETQINFVQNTAEHYLEVLFVDHINDSCWKMHR